jgi:predicted Fe-Mo cluster-binding NifX family protein
MKIAITTTNGLNVDLHFGKANEFHVYRIKDGILIFLGKRNVDAYCISGEDGPVCHEFDEGRFLKIFATISDCRVLYTQQIGKLPEAIFRGMGMDVQVCSCSISSIVPNEASYNL